MLNTLRNKVAVIPIEYFMNCLENEKLVVKGPVPTIKNCIVNDFDDEYALYLRTAKRIGEQWKHSLLSLIPLYLI